MDSFRNSLTSSGVLALALCKCPIFGKVSKEDISKLEEVGFTERDILDINQITSYFAYVNRTADGLGVPLEDFFGK